MRILWLSATSGLLHEREGAGGYGGGGWIGALERLFIASNRSDDTLALSFVSSSDHEKTILDGVLYYPIYNPHISGIAKIAKYYFGKSYHNNERYLPGIHKVIADFQPDIIHLFGLENPLSSIIGHTDVPIVVHIQGLLGPCDNAFFPAGVNSSSFIWPPSKREWLFRNGFKYAKNEIHQIATKQNALFKKTRFFMGRTDFDNQISQFFSPTSRYFVVNEALRPAFYEKAGLWKKPTGKFVITSTISETLYKGLDVVLKAAKLLKDNTDIDFEWNVVGVAPGANIVRLFERITGIVSAAVNVHYIGVLDANAIAENCMKSSVYVHPSYIDNSPNSVCEAQLLGMPVVACNVGGVSSLVEHKRTGILVPANAPYEIACWLKICHDEESFAETLGRQAYQSASIRHDKQNIIKSLLNVYASVLNNN